jgi:hypothetical protein
MGASALLAAALSVFAASGAPAAQHPRAATVDAFHASTAPLGPGTRKRIKGSSWHPGCPVGLADLRLVRVSHWGFDGQVHSGRLVVNKAVAGQIVAAMQSLFRHHYPIRRMRLVDAYGADDHRSMAADNTSAFNCRFINGQPGVWSQHAYGKAIDLNPVENPYVTGSGFVSPPAGGPYADRSRHAAGMVHGGDPTVRAFAAVGWGWGGHWDWPKDFQHFSSNGN